MFQNRGALVGCFWMAVAYDRMRVHGHIVRCHEQSSYSDEPCFCRYTTVHTLGLAPHLWITTRRVYSVKFLGVCPYNVLVFTPLMKSDSRFWHQTHRKTFTSHSNFLASALHLPKGTFTTYFKFFTSFFISGLLHAVAEYAIHQHFSEGSSIRFFVLQAVAITFEDAVIAIASCLGYKSKAFRLIGFIWVFTWFTFSLPIWLDPLAHAGTMDETGRVSLKVQGLFNLVVRFF